MQPRRVDLALLGVAAVWGSSYLAAKTAAAAIGVLPTLSLRYLLGAAALVIIRPLRRPARLCRREVAVGLLLGGTQATVLGLETLGVSLTTATDAGLLISLTIVFTPVLDSVARRNWLPGPFFIAAVLAVVGTALLLSKGGLHRPGLGDGLVLAAAGVRAVHVTLLGTLTAGRASSTLGLTLTQLGVGAVVFSAADLPGLGSAVGSLDLSTWADVVWLALGCGVCAFLVQLWAVRRTSASRASLLMGTEPLWAVLVGLSLGGETLGLLSACGAALIMAATTWGQRIESRHRAAAVVTPSQDVLVGAS
jgi:drug/metabolite transporter (DMT)-like permease